VKRERADLIVGSTTAGAMAIVVAAVIWTAGTWRHDTYPLFTHFSDITGLAPQAAVYLRGYEIGRIREIQPMVTEDGHVTFRVRMDVRWSLAGDEPRALPVGTTALLKPPPVIGSALIELELPDSTGAGRLSPGDVIPGRAELPLTQLASRLSGGVVLEVVETLEAARAMMDTLVLTTIAAREVMEMTGRMLPPTVARLDAQLEEAGAVMTELRRDAALLTPALAAAIDSAHHVLQESRGLIRSMSETIGDNTPLLRSILDNLENTTLVLDHFTRSISERPTRMLTGVRIPPVDTLRRRTVRIPD
jgi:ABC-type transporter Mla subunit MlaD